MGEPVVSLAATTEYGDGEGGDGEAACLQCSNCEGTSFTIWFSFGPGVPICDDCRMPHESVVCVEVDQ